jgi:four helix bundle protein
MHNFENLKFWPKSILFTKEIYLICAKLKQDEKFGLIFQMKRSAVSTPLNIAEGSGRNRNKEFNHFLAIALGSSFELQTQLILAKELQLLKTDYVDNLISALKKIQKMRFTFKNSLNN